MSASSGPTLDREQWLRLSALLDEALDLDVASARQAWLAALRERDAATAAQLERMLRDCGAATTEAQTQPLAPAGFDRRLAQALHLSGATDAADATALRAGERLGAWQLIEKIGEGGMGEVWLAERADGLYEARAAIKLLRADLSGPGLAARFARERALLGRLTHPAIARLLDAGVDQGRAYLVLEHVPGLTLAEHVRAHAPDLASRVRLLIGVAQAVEHAHAQLIVHRDLKPGNVMVTPEGQPKLLDFGVAALLDDDGERADSLLTRQAGRRLTPAYAAPEQISGAPIGVAADVYSLGVMLYELASGVLPFDEASSGSRAALEHAVLHTEPARLSRTQPLGPSLAGPGRPADFARARGDLEAVAAKAMRKPPAQRYASVRTLIDDLQAWLEHRPVSVRSDDWRHRSRLWLRRHAALATGVAMVTLSLAGGLAASLWQWQRATAAAHQSEQVTRYLTELLASANPDLHGGQQPTVMQLLEKSRAELGERFADDPDTRLRLMDVLAGTYRDLNRLDIAIPLAEQAIALCNRHLGSEDERCLDARLDLARVFTTQNSPARVIDILEPLQPELAKRRGAQSSDRASLLYMLAVAYARVGRLADSAQALDLARPIVDKLYRPDQFEHAFFANYVQTLRVAEGRLAEAEAVLRQTEPHWAGAMQRYGRFVITLQRNLLSVQLLRGLPLPQAEAQARRLLAQSDALLGPGNALSASLLAELARVSAEQGELAHALALHEELQRSQQSAAVQHPAVRLPRQVAQLLTRALAADRPSAALVAEASQLLGELDATQAVTGPARAETDIALLHVGLLAQDLELAQRALDSLQRNPVLATSRALASRRDQLEGELLRARGQVRDSIAKLAARVAYLDALPETQRLPAWSARLDLALSQALAGETATATATLQRADALRPAELATAHPLDALRQQLGDSAATPAGTSSRRWDGRF
jgi:serine/threonine-protein kinase